MYKITMWFYCVDRLSIKHEVVRTFEGTDKEEVVGKITRFRNELKGAGWTVVKSAENINKAKLPER
jgi:hypothetical protein